jgi:hypothetical protein
MTLLPRRLLLGRHVRLLPVTGLLPRLALRPGLRALLGVTWLLPRRVLRRILNATLMAAGVVLLRLPRLALRVLLGLRRKLSVTLLRILRLAGIVAVCHLVPLVRSNRCQAPGMKDAKQSKRVYRCDMNDASLFLECYEELGFGPTMPQVLARLSAEAL